ncbi:dehydrogenase [filamentous cyanobacterium CCP5]|nr:dehydrogenase [filamentous cyanobacterium CCP5]
MYDCIIIGAGPAGLATAYGLAQRGRSVLVLEKSPWPRYKPCSGAVSPSIAAYFDIDFAPAINRKLRRVRYTWKLGDPIEAELDTQEPIWIVDRAVFDQFLAEQAQSQGAQIKTATAVTGIEFQGDSWQVNTQVGSFTAQYLVAADGASGRAAGWLGLPQPETRTAAVLEIATVDPVAADCAVWFDFGSIKNGCLWCFPKQQGYSIGAATFRGKNIQDFEKPLAQFAKSLGVAYDPAQVFTHPIRIWDGNQPLHRDRALVVGEAAAIVDPISAEGIRPGMISGVQAAAAIHAALDGQTEALEGYTQTIHATWGDDMQWAQRIASLFYRVPGIGYRVGIKRPSMTTRMGQLLTGEIRYADVANRVMKRLSGGLLKG